MNGIEIPIGTKLTIQGNLCVVKEGRACSSCEIQKMTSSRKNLYGSSMKCGTRENGNTSDFLCSKIDRSDNKNITFVRIVQES